MPCSGYTGLYNDIHNCTLYDRYISALNMVFGVNIWFIKNSFDDFYLEDKVRSSCHRLLGYYMLNTSVNFGF